MGGWKRTEGQVRIFPPLGGFRTNIEAVKNNLIIPESGPVGESTAELDALASYLASTYTSMMPPSDPQFLFLRYAPQGLPVKAFPLVPVRGIPGRTEAFWRLDCPALMDMLPLVLSKVLHDHFGGSSVPVCSITLEMVDLGTKDKYNGVAGNTGGLDTGRTLNAHYFDCLETWRQDLTAGVVDYTTPFSEVKERADFQELWLQNQFILEGDSLTLICAFLSLERPSRAALAQSPRQLAWLAMQEQNND